MTGPKITELTDRSAFLIGGAEARTFLQRLVTVDLDDLSHDRAGYGALLTPQGKILYDFFILQQEENSYLIDCAEQQKVELIKRLGFYRLRAKVTIDEIPGPVKLFAIWNGVYDELSRSPALAKLCQDGLAYQDPRTIEMGLRAVVPFGVEIEGEEATEAAYHDHRIRVGVADSVRDLGSNEVFPHEANLDQFNGVDFAKGCYVGQEVVSRMEHRSAAQRKRILPVSSSGPLESGHEVMAGSKSAGTILSSSGDRALALIRLDRVQDSVSAGQPLLCDGSIVKLHRPSWIDYVVPTADMAA